MRVDELMRSLLRRPLALLMVLVIAAAGAYVGWNRATSTYESTAAVLVVPANATDGTGATDNPLTQLDYSIAQLALVVSSQLSSDGVRDQVVSAGGDGQYTADTLSSQNSAVAQLSPLIRLSATSATADGAQQAVEVLIDQASAQLASVQSASNVPAAAQAKVIDSTPASAGTVVGNPQLRSAGVLGIAGGFIALLLLVVLQPLFGRSRRAPAVERPAAGAATASRAPAPAAGRFAPPAAGRPTVDRSSSQRPAAAPASTRRQDVLRQMVSDEWQRSGSNVPWTRREQRDAYQRAEERLAEKERRRLDLEAENVSRLDDFFKYRDHG